MGGLQLKTGRKTKYTDEVAKRAGELAELNFTDTEIADHLNISSATFYEWRQRHKAFARAIDIGRRRYVEGMIEPAYLSQAVPHDEVVELHELRGRGKKRKMTLIGKRITKNAVNVTAAERILKVHKPEQYGDKLEVRGGLNLTLNVTKNARPVGKS